MTTILVLMAVVQFFSLLAIARLRRALRTVDECHLLVQRETTNALKNHKEGFVAIAGRLNCVDKLMASLVGCIEKLDGRIDKVTQLYSDMRVADMKKSDLQRVEAQLIDAIVKDDKDILH